MVVGNVGDQASELLRIWKAGFTVQLCAGWSLGCGTYLHDYSTLGLARPDVIKREGSVRTYTG